MAANNANNNSTRNIRNVSVVVTGFVHGVGFRYVAKQMADTLNLVGFAENRADGSVSIEVEGDSTAVEKFLVWCRTGPPAAKVERVIVNEGETKDFTEFSIAG